MDKKITENKTNKHFEVDVEIYPITILVYFGEVDFMLKDMKSRLDRKLITKGEYKQIKNFDYNAGCFIMSPLNLSVLYIDRLPTNNVTLSILNHEIFHAVVTILTRCGIKLSKDSEESYAYLTDYISRNIYNKLGLQLSLKN